MTEKLIGIFKMKTRMYSSRNFITKYSNTISAVKKKKQNFLDKFCFYTRKLDEKYRVFLDTQWGDICITLFLQRGDYSNQNANRVPKKSLYY